MQMNDESDSDDEILCQEFYITGSCPNGDNCWKFHMKDATEEEDRESKE